MSASQLLKKPVAAYLGLPTMERKLLAKCSPQKPGQTLDHAEGHLTQDTGLVQAPGISGQGCKESADGGIIPESLALMREAVYVARAKDKTTAQLKGVASELVLGVAGSLSASASLEIVPPQQVKRVCGFEFHGGIGFALFVEQQRKSDACFFAESPCVDAIAKPYRRQVRSAVSESLLVGAQLRDVLAAEDSAIVTQEDNYGGLAEPKRAKTEFPAVHIRERNHRKAAAEGAVHSFYCELPERRVKPASAGSL